MSEFQDPFDNSDYLSELIGSEVSGGYLQNGDVVGNTCLYFDGANDYVDVGNNVRPNSNNFSISYWAYTPSPLSNYRAVYATPGNRLFVGSLNLNNYVQIYTSTGWYKPSGSSVLTSGWHHYCMTKSSTTGLKLYVDGALDINWTHVTANMSYSNGNCSIGGQLTSWDWRGNIANVVIYNEVLSADDVADEISYGVDETKNIYAWWELADGTGSTATDSSSNGRNGTISGATWASRTASKIALSRTTSTNLLAEV